MLKLCRKFNELDLQQLLDVYRQSLDERTKQESISTFRAEADFTDYLKEDFFLQTDAFCAVLIKSDRYVSALRMEPYEDGFLLSGLETKQACRREGCATELVMEVLSQMPEAAIYAHVHKKNCSSLTVHRKCGFVIVHDVGRLLDGTVSNQYYTLVKK